MLFARYSQRRMLLIYSEKGIVPQTLLRSLPGNFCTLVEDKVTIADPERLA